MSDLWYKDAVFYEVHVKAFQDSNDDGVGDFPGLTSRLDYIQGLGATGEMTEAAIARGYALGRRSNAAR